MLRSFAPVEDGGGLQVGPVFRREKSWGCLVVVGILKDFSKIFSTITFKFFQDFF